MAISVTGLPVTAFVGNELTFEVIGGNAGYEYRFMVLTNGAWNYSAPFTSDTTFTYTPTKAELSALQLTVRDTATGLIVSDQTVKQYYVQTPEAASGLFDQISRYNIADVDSVVSQQAAQQGWRAGITSFDDFYNYVEGQFAVADVNAAGLGSFSVDARKAMFMVQWVSGLWALGNEQNPAATGAVLDNEVTGVTPAAAVTIQTFMDSPIACCTDYATMLGFLLSKAGIPNRFMTLPGHIFNEAFIDGKWWTLDSNFGVAYEGSWDRLVDRTDAVNIYAFQDAGMETGSDSYREAHLVGLHTLLTLSSSGFSDQFTRIETTNYYSWIAYGDVFLDALNVPGRTSDAGTAVALSTGTRFARGLKWSDAVTDKMVTGDFDGDGKSDLMRQAVGYGVEIQLSTGTEFSAGSLWSSATSHRWWSGDFNGDGKDDLARYQSSVTGAEIFISNGSGFNAPQLWSNLSSAAQGWYSGDFDGDGKSDIFRYVTGVSSADMYLSNGSTFVSAGSWTSATATKWYVGDFNGDGKDDVLRHDDATGAVSVLLSSGSAFGTASTWLTVAATGRVWQVGDVNGDGKDDLIATNGAVYKSNGSAFVLDNSWISPGAGYQTWLPADFNGDGRDDLMFMPDEPGTVDTVPTLLGLTKSEFARLGYQALGRFDLSNSDSDVSRAASATGWRAGISTFDLLYTAITSAFGSTASADAGTTGMTTAQAKATFFMQWIGGMAALGNAVAGPTDGRALSNELTGVTSDYLASAQHYIHAQVADESDLASMFSLMMSKAGLENRLVLTEERILNEVNVEGVWWTFDVATSTLFKADWATVAGASQNVDVEIFDNMGREAGSDTFRAAGGQLLHATIQAAANGYLASTTTLSPMEWFALRADSLLWLGESALIGTYAMTNGRDYAAGGASDNAFGGGNGIDVLVGGSGSDVVSGGEGRDYLVGGQLGSQFAAAAAWSDQTSGNWRAGDFNGDGKDDVLRTVNGVSGAQVFLSNGSGFTLSGSWSPAGGGTHGWYVGDFTGDGKDDILRNITGSGAQVMASNGTGFTSLGAWTTATTTRWYVGDFNGDGKDDLFRYVPGVSGADVYLSDGNRFLSGGSWTGAGGGTYGWQIGDFNGDGKDDLLRSITGKGAEVFLSTGTGFAAPVVWSATTGNWRAGDFNHDGLSDVMRVVSGGIEIMTSTGTAFAAATAWTTAVPASSMLIGDFDGAVGDDVLSFTASSAPTLMLSGTGGAVDGRDIFSFTGEYGNDTVMDFVVSGVDHDVLAFSQYDFDSEQEVLAQMVQVGGDTQITVSAGNTLTLENVLKSSLTADHILIV